MFRVGGRGSGTTTAHRVAYILTHGPVDDEDVVCHECDNRSCVNPHHLFVGSQADNIHDCISKDRHYRGQRTHMAKLTADDVREIRSRYAAGGESYRTLATEFGVDHTQIANIIKRRQWRHLP